VAITIVDNAGIARVKTVPVTGLEHTTRWGLGLSPMYGVATVDESFTSTASVGGPSGDLRLMPDSEALRILTAQPGWAWGAADQYTQDGRQFGGHLHVSVSRHGRNLLAGGAGPHGMTEDGQAFIAGVLDQLPALTAIGAPSAASYLRLRLSRRAGAFACWGAREPRGRTALHRRPDRQPAGGGQLRDQVLRPGRKPLPGDRVGHRRRPGRDRTAARAASRSHRRSRHRPDPGQRVRIAGRLPESLDHALAALRRSDVIPPALGPMLHDAFIAVRAAEAETFHGQDPETIAAAHRWLY
jgi:glutamine synthetase